MVDDMRCNLTDNAQFAAYLSSRRKDWCRHVDHKFEYGRHLDAVTIVSTYQINLPLQQILKYCKASNYRNPISVGDIVTVRLPFNTRSQTTLSQLEIQRTENCVAINTGQNHLYAEIPIGQFCTITLVELRFWNRVAELRSFRPCKQNFKKCIVLGKEKIFELIPTDEAESSTVTITSLNDNVIIENIKAFGYCILNELSSSVTLSTCKDQPPSNMVSFELRVRSRWLVVAIPMTLLFVLASFYIGAFTSNLFLDRNYSIVELIAPPLAVLGIMLNVLYRHKQNLFESSFFRFGEF